MSVSPAGLKSFKTLYQKQCGEELNEEELERKARLLLNLYLAIYQSPVETIRQTELAPELACRQNY